MIWVLGLVVFCFIYPHVSCFTFHVLSASGFLTLFSCRPVFHNSVTPAFFPSVFFGSPVFVSLPPCFTCACCLCPCAILVCTLWFTLCFVLGLLLCFIVCLLMLTFGIFPFHIWTFSFIKAFCVWVPFCVTLTQRSGWRLVFIQLNYVVDLLSYILNVRKINWYD